MVSEDTFTRLQERRLERMRQGQQTAEIEKIPSDPEIRVALVPLLEGEYDECQKAAAEVHMPDNVAGATVRDREERRQVVYRASREVDDYSKQAFPSAHQMSQVIEPTDVNYLYSSYVQMISKFSPSISTLEPDEIDFLSDLFVNLDWKDLSGEQVFALSRFLSTLRQEQLMGSLPGRLSTRS